MARAWQLRCWPPSGAISRLGPLLVRAVADAVDHDERTLVRALRRLADDLPAEDDAELATFASMLAEIRLLPPTTQRAIGRVLIETIALAAPRRRW